MPDGSAWARWAEPEIVVDGPFGELATRAEPAVEDWAIKLMNLIARSPLLTRKLVLNDKVFYPVRRAVMRVRALFGAPFGHRPRTIGTLLLSAERHPYGITECERGQSQFR